MQRVLGVGAEIDNQMTALCNNHRLQQYLSSSTATKFWAPTYYDNPPQKCKPTPPLCYRKPLVSAIDGQCINRRACKKSAYYILYVGEFYCYKILGSQNMVMRQYNTERAHENNIINSFAQCLADEHAWKVVLQLESDECNDMNGGCMKYIKRISIQQSTCTMK